MEFSIEVIHLMHPGKRKDPAGNPHQEDSIFPEAEKLNHSDRFFVVCDGMGGHDSGEVASDTVCRAMGDYITSECDAQGDFSHKDLNNAIDAAFRALDAADTGAARKMGTTMAMLKLYDKGAIVAHIGDSRVYHIRPQENHDTAEVLHRTYDHSLVFNMVKAGIMTEEEARTSPHKNVITKALQPHLEHQPKPDITKITDIRPGDFFYLCSDGMLENMDSPELGEIFSKEGDDLTRLRDTLLDLTEENHDNHTAIIVHILSVEKPEDEDLSDDFDKFTSKPEETPPPFKREKFEKSENDGHDTSSENDEFTYLYGQDSKDDESDSEFDNSRPNPPGCNNEINTDPSRSRWWIYMTIACIVVICAGLAIIYGFL